MGRSKPLQVVVGPVPAHDRFDQHSVVVPVRTLRRLAVLQERDGINCSWCGGPLVLAEALPRRRPHRMPGWWPTFDHVRPRSLGGAGTLENLQVLHLLCNQEKGDGRVSVHAPRSTVRRPVDPAVAAYRATMRAGPRYASG